MREVEVWRAAVDAGAPPAEELEAWLSGEELARAGRLLAEEARHRYVRAHAFLRGVLGRHLGCGPGAVALVLPAEGKPALADAGDLRFNLSHSGEVALVALAHGREVGADVEQVRALRASERLARRVLSPAELRAFERNPRDARLLELWTRKEAVLKALGEGLTRRDPARLDVSGELVAPAGAGTFSVASFRPVPGYVAAVAADGPGLELRMSAWDWSVTAPPA